jgi:glycine/D-amino acid oxidase-like deaminating enzyme
MLCGDVVMAFNIPAAYGVYSNNVALPEVVQILNQSGFSKEDICMMVSPKHPLATVVREANILQAEGGTGVTTAGMMAWLMKFGAVMIPRVGLFIRSKAFLEALMAKEASSHGYSNGLVELGFSEDDAARFENELDEMGVLVYIACPGSAKRAMEVLRLTGASEAATLERATFQKQSAPQMIRGEVIQPEMIQSATA